MQIEQLYQSQLKADGYAPDPAQQAVLNQFQRIYNDLQKPVEQKDWRFWRSAKTVAVDGLYLWGGVGRGKTWLMDLFYDNLGDLPRERLHFHRFMRHVHAELTDLKGESEPLQRIAERMGQQWRLLCLDEFHVVDIGDAMILAGLLRNLFEEGVTLVTTSNAAPDSLYKDGIQRASFLPAIALLKTHTEVIEMGGDRDFRQQLMTQSPVYHTPANAQSDALMEEEFRKLASTAVHEDGEMSINGRIMPYRFHAEGMVWFDFEALCGPPRSQMDYIELSRRQHTVFLSHIPTLGPSKDDAARRFIFLIDEFYDRKVKLVISAAEPFDRLYMGERLAFEFERTSSRITEMQSAAYIGLPHEG